MQGLFFEDLSVGQSAETTKVVTANDVEAFAAVSGDTNPVHLDEDYAQTTTFQTRIAHGMLSGAYISAVIGTKQPGPGSIYLSQSMRFHRPVKLGDAVVTRVTIQALDEARGHATLATVCQVNGKTVVDGEAVIMVPRKGA